MTRGLKFIGCFTLLLFIISGLTLASQMPGEPLLFFRFANFVPGTQVDFSIDNQLAEVSRLDYKAFSEWAALPASTYNLSVNATGDSLMSGTSLELVEGNWYTIAALATADGSLKLDLIEETFVEVAPGTAWVTYVNAIQGGPTVDFVRSGSTYVPNLFPLGNEEKQYSWYGLLDYVDTFDFQVVETGHPQNTLVEADKIALRENELYLIAAVGTSDPDDDYDVELLVENTNMAEVMLVQGNMERPGTIIQAARAHTELSPWLEAVKQAELVETLSSAGPYTVFVPANFSFDNLPIAVREDSLALADLLSTYIVKGDLRSQDILKASTVTTLAGNLLNIGASSEDSFVSANIPATNGVIHVVNGLVSSVQQISQ